MNSDHIRNHAILESLHASVQLHQQAQLDQDKGSRKESHSSSTKEMASAATIDGSMEEKEWLCPRCKHQALMHKSNSHSGDLGQLYATALSRLSPFATLSPNLSQLALITQTTATINSHEAKTDEIMKGLPRNEWEEFIDLDTGCLIWSAFSSESIPDLTSACQRIQPFIINMTIEQFHQFYGPYLDMSSHSRMIPELFQIFREGCQMNQKATEDNCTRGATSPLIFMVVSSQIERLIGDIFCARRSSPNVVCPRMLRDLFLTDELIQFLPPQAMFLLQTLCGSPKYFNIRNILWHGFLYVNCQQTHQVLLPFTSMLWLVFMSLLKESQRIWRLPIIEPAPATNEIVQSDSIVNSQANNVNVEPSPNCTSSTSSSPLAPSLDPTSRPYRRPLKHLFLGDAALFSHLNSPLFTTIKPDATKATLSSHPSSTMTLPSDSFKFWPISPSMIFQSSDSAFQSISTDFSDFISHSYLIPHHRLHDLIHAFQFLRTNPYLALTILLPTIEQILRHLFVYSNSTLANTNEPNPNIDYGLLLAQTEKLFTTLDIVMDVQVPLLTDEPEEEAVAASPQPAQQQKCDRNSAFSFPMVPTPCQFDPSSPRYNQLYVSDHSLMPSQLHVGANYALFDLALSRLGPRLRDRLAHGEIQWKDEATLPNWLAVWSFNVLLGLAIRFPICRPNDPGGRWAVPEIFNSPLALRVEQVFDRYQPITHPRSQFMIRMAEVHHAIQHIERTVQQIPTDASQTELDSDQQPSPTDLLLTSSAFDWYRFSLNQPIAIVESRGLRVLLTDSANNMIVGGNSLVVQCGLILRQLQSMEPDMPLWAHLDQWITNPAATIHDQPQAQDDLTWWNLSTHPFWLRSHHAYHHPSHSASSIETLPPTCTFACQFQCFDHCMQHSPVVAIQRILDLLLQIPLLAHTAYQALHAINSGPDAPSSKRRLYAEVQHILPMIVLCCTTTLSAMMILWEQFMRKAHPTPGSTPMDPAILLRVDRSIGRLLKKSTSSLPTLVTHYRQNRWLLALNEWRIILYAIQYWYTTITTTATTSSDPSIGPSSPSPGVTLTDSSPQPEKATPQESPSSNAALATASKSATNSVTSTTNSIVKPADPNLDHLTSSTYEHVYEPSEDSYLLMDAMYEDLDKNGMREKLHTAYPTCLEVGPGTGIIITYLSNLLDRRGYFLAIDINPHATRATRATMRQNHVLGDVIQGHLVASVLPRLRQKLDILIFNPPYVPTPPEELLGEGISRSWAGGEKGREILDQLLPNVQHLLAPHGVFYCVLLSSNLPDEVAAILKEHGGFEAQMILRRRAGIEDLQIVRYSRPPSTSWPSPVIAYASPSSTAVSEAEAPVMLFQQQQASMQTAAQHQETQTPVTATHAATVATQTAYAATTPTQEKRLENREDSPTDSSLKRAKWTASEDEELKRAVSMNGGRNWKKIAQTAFGGMKTDVQCLHRWQKVLDPKLVKGPWTAAEDAKVVALVTEWGPQKWSLIASHLPGRIGKQCRERWHNHLNPNIKKEQWTPEEDQIILRLHQTLGNQWALMTKYLPGRPDNAIKNRWNSLKQNYVAQPAQADANGMTNSSGIGFEYSSSVPVTLTPTSPATSLYKDALQSIFLFLTLKEFVQACLVHPIWYATGRAMKPRKDQLKYDRLLSLLVQSPFRVHISRLVLYRPDIHRGDENSLQSCMGHLDALTLDVMFKEAPVYFTLPCHLQELSISFQFWNGCRLARAYLLECIKQIVAHSTHLVKLHIGLWTDEGLMDCPRELEAISSLTDLTLPGIIHLDQQVDLIQSMPGLKRWLPPRGRSADAIRLLADSPRSPPPLEDIGPFYVVDEIKAVQLQRLSTLTRCHFICMTLEDPTLLLPHLPHLSTLDLMCEDTVRVDHLSSALATCINLTSLVLTHSYLTSDHLSLFLPHLRQLEELKLFSCSRLLSLEFLTNSQMSLTHLTNFEIYDSHLPLNEFAHLHAISPTLEYLTIAQLSERFDEAMSGRWTPGSIHFRRDEWPRLQRFSQVSKGREGYR